MSDPRHACRRCRCPSGPDLCCEECDDDSEGEDIATADERSRLYSYIGKVRDMHPLAAAEVTP